MSDIAARGIAYAVQVGERHPHGTRTRYAAGRCRCDACRDANTRYERERAEARKRGEWNGLVDASRAAAHLHKLSKQGVGRRAVCAASDVAMSVVHEIKSGRKTRIRAMTERALLAVTPAVAAESALIPSAETKRLLRELRAEGFTFEDLARRLGYVARDVQVRGLITVRKADRIRRLHQALFSEALVPASFGRPQPARGRYAHRQEKRA